MTCPCRATEYALMENAKRGKRVAELEECLLTAEERLEQMTRERDAERRTFANAADAMGCEPEDGDDFVEAVKELTRERDDAREQLYLTKAELGRWVDRETKAVRERDEARREADRLRHGNAIEGDFVCPDSLALTKSQAEVARLSRLETSLPASLRDAHVEVDRLHRLLKMAEDEAVAADDHGRDQSMRADRLEAERDEARAEVSRLQEDRDKWRDRYHAMRIDVGLSGDVEDEITCAYRRGAEAMREACAQMEPYAYNLDDHLMISKWRSLVRALPIPEEP